MHPESTRACKKKKKRAMKGIDLLGVQLAIDDERLQNKKKEKKKERKEKRNDAESNIVNACAQGRKRESNDKKKKNSRVESRRRTRKKKRRWRFNINGFEFRFAHVVPGDIETETRRVESTNMQTNNFLYCTQCLCAPERRFRREIESLSFSECVGYGVSFSCKHLEQSKQLEKKGQLHR